MNWPLVPLNEIAQVGAGNSAPQEPKLFEDGIIPFIRTSDVGQIRFGHIDGAEDMLNKKGMAGLRLWPAGTILFPKSGASTFLNHRVIMDVEACVASHLATIVTNPSRAIPKYLLYFLHTIRAQDLTQDQDYPSLRLPEIGAIRIPLPSLAEQKRIVAFLDEAFAGIAQASANATRNLANADELFDSELQTLINHAEDQGKETSFVDICDITSSLVDPKLDVFQNLLHVGGGNMVTKSDDLIELKTAKEEKLISGKFLFDESMVLYSKIRPYLMKVSRPDFSGLCSADVYPLSPRKNILDRDYLFFVLLTKKFTEYAISGSGRAGMPKVNRNHLFAYSLKIPSISAQKDVVQKLNQTMGARDRLKQNYLKKQNTLTELKSSLLHQAFSGKLTGKEAAAA